MDMPPSHPPESSTAGANPKAVTSQTVNVGTHVAFAHTDPMMPTKAPGSGMVVFARYKLERVLGRGGMGVVWLAEDLKLERPVALKFLPSLAGVDPGALKELKTETRRGLELSHPNIVRIYDFVDDEDAAAISMEYVDGKTLSELRMGTEHGIFTVDEISHWLPGVCDALDYAHFQRKLVHRDLKPANIMLTSQENLAKVADFGIARSLSDTMSRVSAAHIGTSGTLPYMSPQQAMGERPLPTDDVYSLGATLYELLAGKPPFYRGDLAIQINSKIPPKISERRQELGIELTDTVPQEWEDAIAACLNKDPHLRPSCAGALAEMLGHLPSGGTRRNVTTSFGPGVTSGATTQRRSRVAPLVATAAVLSIAGGAAWYVIKDRGVSPNNQALVRPTPPAATERQSTAAPAAEPTKKLASAASPAPAKPAVNGVATAGETHLEDTPLPTQAQPQAPGTVNAAPGVGAGLPVAQPAVPGMAQLPANASSRLDGLSAVPMPLIPDPASTVAAATAALQQQAPLTLPPGSGPLPEQPAVSEPQSGFWTVEQLYPTQPFAAYSESGKKYLLYRTQSILKGKGLYTSTVDGKEGKSTHNAIQLFQAKNNLRPTGLLDIPTLAALELAEEADNSSWAPPTGSPGGGVRRAPGGGRYTRQSKEPNFLERTGGKIRDLFSKDDR